MKTKIFIAAILIAATLTAEAQTLTYNAFIDSLKNHNASYLAQALNIDISQAEARAARTSQDPTISIEYGNNSDWSIAMGQSASAEISKALSPGKTASRIAVAREQLSLSKAELDDYWRNLKADASIAFYHALLARQLLTIDSQAYRNISHLASADSIRYTKGEISEIDMLQSRLEQTRALQQLNSRRTEFHNALMVLEQYCGQSVHWTNIEGTLSLPIRLFNLQQLLDHALTHRADLLAADCNITLVQQQEILSIRERRSDVELSLGANYNTQVINEEAPAPEFMGYTICLSLPLPVNSINSGVRRAAKLRQQQAQLQSQSVRSAIQSEVTRSFNTYVATLQRAQAYSGTLMNDSQLVLNGKLYAYHRGETSLLDLLSAQQTFNEIQEEYASSLYDSMVALIELQRAAGL